MAATVLFDLRRENLSQLIDYWIESKRFETGKAICDYFGLEHTYIVQLLNSKRQIGEKAARELEQKLRLEPHCLDQTIFNVTDVIKQDTQCFDMQSVDAELIQLDVSKAHLQIPDYLNLAIQHYLIWVKSDAYRPYLKIGDILLLDREKSIQAQNQVCVYFKNGYQLILFYLKEDLIHQHFQSLDGKRKVSFQLLDIEQIHRIEAIITT